MKLKVEISLYPLTENFIPLIDSFITRVNKHEGVTVWTNDLSTQIMGDYDKVMHVINEEMKISFEDKTKMVFVVKFHSPGA